MTIAVHPSERCRHIVLRISGGVALPEALASVLAEQRVTCGWLRASGILADVDLRAYDADLGGPAAPRRIAGPVQVLALEGSIGRTNGETSFSMRALLAREIDRGLETLAGEIIAARAVALELLVTALDDLTLERNLDSVGVWLLGNVAPTRSTAAARPIEAAAGPAWSPALAASERTDAEPSGRARPGPAAGFTAGAATMPARPVRPPSLVTDGELLFPEPGSIVEHFAFGACEVLKSDGDRLHLRVGKDGRIREIALEMLRVSPLPDSENGTRRFKLERRM